MPIYTPRGLKVRISVQYAFGLLSRLHPKISAFQVLKMTEGIESLPTAISFIAAIICFLLKLDYIPIFIIVVASYLFSALMNISGFFIIPGLVSIGTIFSYISGYGVYLIIIFIIGYLNTGIKGVIAFFLGKLCGWIITNIFEHFDTKRIYKLTGHPFTASERNFFNAYRLHASRIGVTTNIELSDDELKEEFYKLSFDKLARDWPEVVSRFSSD